MCLAELNDRKNAMAALEKATGLPDAAKYPLIYLNFAIYCYQNQVYDRSVENVHRYVELVEGGQQPLSNGTKNVRHYNILVNYSIKEIGEGNKSDRLNII